MATFQDVANKIKTDPAFLGQLLVNPQSALAEAGLGLSNEADARKLEGFLRSAQAHVAAAGSLVGMEAKADNWGIGFGCCNSFIVQ